MGQWSYVSSRASGPHVMIFRGGSHLWGLSGCAGRSTECSARVKISPSSYGTASLHQCAYKSHGSNPFKVKIIVSTACVSRSISFIWMYGESWMGLWMYDESWMGLDQACPIYKSIHILMFMGWVRPGWGRTRSNSTLEHGPISGTQTVSAWPKPSQSKNCHAWARPFSKLCPSSVKPG